MKKALLLLLLGSGFLGAGTGCSEETVKKAIEKNPGIVFEAIKKDPSGFMAAVNEAVKKDQEAKQREAAEGETKALEEQFKNPLKPALEEGRHVWGPADAPITIFEYSDFQCPFCARGHNTIEQVKKEYAGKVRLVFKHLPLEDIHPQARNASRYFEAIGRQSVEKAYEFQSFLFDNQPRIKEGEKFLKEAAKQVGANQAQIDAALKDKAIDERIDKDMEEARAFGISGTPGFIINGVALKGAYPFENFKTIIDRHLAGK